MRWLLVIAMCACGPSDECATIAKKVRPVLAKMGTDVGKPMSDAQLDTFSAEMCPTEKDHVVDARERKFRDCVLASTSDGMTAACVEPLFAEYRDATKAAAEKAKTMAELDAKKRELDHKRDAIEHELAATREALADAGVAAAKPKPKVTPVDPATLANWPVPAGTKASGPATAVYAVEVDTDRLLGLVWDPQLPLLVPKHGGTVTGKVEAKSRTEAVAAVLAATGIAPKPPVIAGHGANVDLSFAAAPQRDLFRLFADVLKINIVVAPGDLPDVDIVVKRKPGDGVLAALVALDQRTLIRSGNTAYVIDAAAKLPPPVATKGGRVTLATRHASAAEALAAIRAVVPQLSVGACDGKPLDMRVRDVPAAEAVRAVLVASGATLTTNDGGCSIAKATAVPATGVVVAIATSGKTSAAVVRTGTSAGVIEQTTGIEIGATYVTAGTTSLQLYPPPDMPSEFSLEPTQWLATFVRTAAIIHSGKNWNVLLANDKGNLLSFDYRRVEIEVMVHPTITATGLAYDTGTSRETIPLAKP